jgi:hypothetical protein
MVGYGWMVGIWLEYGWNMVGIWLEYGWNMVGIWLEYGWICLDVFIAKHIHPDFQQLPTTSFLQPWNDMPPKCKQLLGRRRLSSSILRPANRNTHHHGVRFRRAVDERGGDATTKAGISASSVQHYPSFA